MVMRACMVLNLKGHTVIERSTKTPKVVYGPVDLEGHLGTDGRYYIVDTGKQKVVSRCSAGVFLFCFFVVCVCVCLCVVLLFCCR